jgi:hypothetical protein
MVTGDQLAIAKETGRRLGMGDHMYPSKVLKDGPEPGGKFATLDEMILGKLTANLHSFPGGLLTCDLFFRR